MQKVQITPVRFKVARAIELEPGFVLRPGVYTGIKTRTRVDSIGGLLFDSPGNGLSDRYGAHARVDGLVATGPPTPEQSSLRSEWAG